MKCNNLWTSVSFFLKWHFYKRHVGYSTVTSHHFDKKKLTNFVFDTKWMILNGFLILQGLIRNSKIFQFVIFICVEFRIFFGSRHQMEPSHLVEIEKFIWLNDLWFWSRFWPLVSFHTLFCMRITLKINDKKYDKNIFQ